MKKILKITAIICIAVLVLCSCGAGSAPSDSRKSIPSQNTAALDSYYPAMEESAGIANYNSGEYITADNKSTAPTQNSALYNAKVIRRASLSVQSTEFDETKAVIESMVDANGGYIENVEVYNGNSYRSTSYKNASFTVRIPAQNFQAFLSGMSSECHVVSLSQSAEDVGEQYFNTEQKLETLNNKHDRLEELLKKAENMSDIIELENALSNCEYEINMYQTTLNRYDSLIGFSTINISLQEVSRPADGIDENPGFFTKLSRSFTEGLERFADGAENFVLWLSSNILTLIIIVVVVVLVVKLHPISRIKNSSQARREKREAKRLQKQLNKTSGPAAEENNTKE